MRSALLCVFFALIVRRGSLADNEFRPTPIPLNEWRYERREGRAGTLHEAIRTDAPVAVAAIPAHYWEDALRHSVYLTLVRDKIDQLIAKGDVIAPDSKPDQYLSKDIDDHDLWEKIKTAPFDRIQQDELPSFGDVTILAKGRLVEENAGYRFTEDDRSKEKCADDKCLESVKAFWSVKRVRQRDSEISPGKYHYELTFSVNSQQPKKQKKPYENPVRTFTVKESPDQVLDMPQENRGYERQPVVPSPSIQRPGRAIWVHKNIVPTSMHHGRQYHRSGLDSLFSLFSDDDDEYEPPRYRPHVQAPPPYQYQYSKVGHLGSPSDQQKRLTPYPYKPHTYKYSRPIQPTYAHVPHHYAESDTIGYPYATPPDHRFGPPTKPVKTTRPAVLPTPLPPVTAPTSPKNWTEADTIKSNSSENGTRSSELYPINKPYTKPTRPVKINYFSDHVRPPIYSAPPGVFVTMDKKPFKPMPPLKFIHKPMKYNKPMDFRPSPQVLDMQHFSEPDAIQDTAFRPITWNYNETFTTTERIDVAETTLETNTTNKSIHKGKKPPKKHENIKGSRSTTSPPEIITASSDSIEEESDAMQWANVVGAFSKTTPMASEKKPAPPESTTTSTTSTSSTTVSTTTALRRRITTTTEAVEETTTTRKPKPKRTRPPPKFTKPDKYKKPKRVTSTTTKQPDVRSTQDLTPQASSSSALKPKPQTTSTSTSTSTTTTTTTPRPTTTTTRATTITTTTHSPSTPDAQYSTSTTQPKIKNRFRQSTLMQKGTSVNHDKWSAPVVAPTSPEKTKTTVPILPGKIPRRKGSNFHGYVSSTTSRSDLEYEKIHEDQGHSKTLSVKPLSTTTQNYEETADQYDHNDESSDYDNNRGDEEEEESENDEQESRDHTEYIFQTSTAPSERTNEVDHESNESITTEQIITSPFSAPKNKTKCKKKKQNVTSTEENGEFITEQSSSTSTTTEASTPSIFEELFGSFTVDDSNIDKKETQSTPKPDLQQQGSEKHGRFVKLDDDLQEFLDSIERGSKNVDIEEEYDDEDAEIDDEDFIETEESPSARDSSDNYDDEPDDKHDNPFSLLELMAME